MDYDTLAADYARHRRVHPGVLADLVEGGHVSAAAQVLEVGCGTGNYSVALHEATGCAGWGLDPSVAMLAQAERRLPAARLRQGRAERLSYPDASFDLVFSVDVIHHVADRGAYFREACRVLKPGGRVCTVTDSEDIIRARRPMSAYFPETVAVELARYPRLADLRQTMEAAGFADLSETTAEFAFAITDLQPYRDKAFSCLHLISDEALGRGLRHMERDVAVGPLPAVARYLLLWGVRRVE